MHSQIQTKLATNAQTEPLHFLLAAVQTEIRELVALKAEQNESYRRTLSGSLKRLTLDLADETAALEAPAPVAIPSEPLDELFRATLRRVWAA